MRVVKDGGLSQTCDIDSEAKSGDFLRTELFVGDKENPIDCQDCCAKDFLLEVRQM